VTTRLPDTATAVDEERLRVAFEQVADRTLDFDFSVWYWGDAIAIDGLLEAAELLDADRFANAADTYAKRWIRRVLTAGCTWVDHLAPGWAILRLGRRCDDERYLEAVRVLAEFLADAPRSRRLGVPLRRPDIFGDRNLTVVDSMYNEGSLFTHIAEVTGEERYLDWGRDVLEPMTAALLDSESGLFRQAVDLATGRKLGLGWGRGTGWALLGILDALEFIPPTRPERQRLAHVVRTVSEQLLVLQDAGGYWHTILQNRNSYLETSTAAFFAAVFDKGTRLGVLDRREVGEASDRALAALLERIDDSGSVFGVSADSLPADEQAYLPLPMGSNEWGQGCAMRALAERIRLVSHQKTGV
jgi:unsaturated rhamnogalacturonyl hydrolase